jgi:CRP-like cAMP-binding protein
VPSRLKRRLLQLKEFGVLRSLDDAQAAVLENHLQFTHLTTDEVLLNHGDLKDFIYILAEGRLRVQLPSSDDQKIIEAAKLWPGDVIGEMSLLTGEKHSATVIALQPCSLIQIAKSDIAPLLKSSPSLTQAIVDQVLLIKQANEHLRHHKVDQHERSTLLKRVFQFIGINS